MKDKVVEIKGDSRMFFRSYIKLLSSFKPLNGVRHQELMVLAELMYSNYVISQGFKNREDPNKWKLIFSYENKREIEEILQISDATMANCLTNLRKVNFIQDNTLRKMFRVYPDDKFELIFKFTNTQDAGGSTEDNK
jgi:plasmid maintenance system killer protein